MTFTKTTEQSSKYEHLEQMSVHDLLSNINNEDKTVPLAVEKALPQIETLVTKMVEQMKKGGRLFYIGAGTSGRLGIVDASECPPTFGVPFDLVIGIIAGGDTAIRKAVEFAEDDKEQAWKDLQEWNINENDVVIGIAASGTTPYVIGGLEKCNENNITTGCITCNQGSPLSQTAQLPIEVVVGPEFVTGSSRMKAGTAQKMVLNMISTTAMIQLGRVKGNKMVDMQLSNVKLIDRGTRMIMEEIPVTYEEAEKLLKEFGSVRKAIEHYNIQMKSKS
ncbi:N-acetylmuramic acid 6-phosphate etherase [Flavobacterium luminosum]|uniref:N-acetylmuramic acid 6-phosphate etherase n=1 Tax=Flavobacterium luminosum TaxID=2949086 RepID=A0ABT0TPL1_9FLAO|nr:N-acetylmuramic acid 6-phosphate etherase [Flavobacterium sp. HXWNR70]MCL9808813.1 N-acetylmuramic acid 6-phosphate etherase [Flavobacterium sp. HXWNR70]